MARYAVAAAGALIGFLVAGPQGALIGWSVGGIVGGLLFPEKQKPQLGPRLEDVQLQQSTYGQPLPWVWGRARLSGQVIWMTKIMETFHKVRQSGGGGKGGSSKPKQYEFDYHGNWSVAICRGPGSVRTIWADQKTMYSNDLAGTIVNNFEQKVEAVYNTPGTIAIKGLETIRVYSGLQDQGPSTLMEIYDGVDLHPHYHGVLRVDFGPYIDLSAFGNRIPQCSFEVDMTYVDGYYIKALPCSTPQMAYREDLRIAPYDELLDYSMMSYDPVSRKAYMLSTRGYNVTTTYTGFKNKYGWTGDDNLKVVGSNGWGVPDVFLMELDIDSGVVAEYKVLDKSQMIYDQEALYDFAHDPFTGDVWWTTNPYFQDGASVYVARKKNGWRVTSERDWFLDEQGGVTFLGFTEDHVILYIWGPIGIAGNHIVWLSKNSYEEYDENPTYYTYDNPYGGNYLYVPGWSFDQLRVDKVFWFDDGDPESGSKGKVDTITPFYNAQGSPYDWKGYWAVDRNGEVWGFRHRTNIGSPVPPIIERFHSGGSYSVAFSFGAASSSFMNAPSYDGVRDAEFIYDEDRHRFILFTLVRHPSIANAYVYYWGTYDIATGHWTNNGAFAGLMSGSTFVNDGSATMACAGMWPHSRGGATNYGEIFNGKHLWVTLAMYPVSGGVVDNNVANRFYVVACLDISTSPMTIVEWHDERATWAAMPQNQVVHATAPLNKSMFQWYPSYYDPQTRSILDVARFTYKIEHNNDPYFWGYSFGDCPTQFFLGKQRGSPCYLRDIVRDICDAAGLAEYEDYDVSGLGDQTVSGYVATNQSSARSMLEPLQQAYFFDGIEVDGKIFFRYRTGASKGTISEHHLGARAADSSTDTPRVIETRVMDVEIPSKVVIRFSSMALRYETGVQYFERLFGAQYADQQMTIDLPLVMDDGTARSIAERHIVNTWTMRNAYEWTVPINYIRFDPGDVVTLQWDDLTVPVYITEMNVGGDGLIQMKGSASGTYVYGATSDGPVQEPRYPEFEIPVLSETVVQTLDGPLLASEMNAYSGFLVMGEGADPSGKWPGAAVYASSNNTDFIQVGAIPVESIIGTADTLLPAANHCLIDRTSVLRVTIVRGILTSVTEADLLAGDNRAMVGDELIGFAKATQVAEGVYDLSVLLRGLQGTEWACGGHAIGDRFVYLTDGTVGTVEVPEDEIGLQRYFKAVTYSMGLDTADSFTFTPQNNHWKPIAPVHIRGARDGSDNLTISWVPRARMNFEWRDNIEPSIDEPVESYVVEIYDGPTKVRSMTVGAPVAPYSAADQTADFGSPQSQVTVMVYQVSNRVGKGYPGTATV